MYPDQYEHLHQHLRQIEDRLDRVEHALGKLTRLEIVTSLKEMSAMAKQSDEIGKLSDKFDTLGGVVTDIHSDFEALRAVLENERENLSPAGQAAVDAANAKAESLSAKLRELDVSVGDADGSDIPTPAPGDGGGETPPVEGGGTGGETPVDQAPPAGEGTVFAPDTTGDSDTRPTA